MSNFRESFRDWIEEHHLLILWSFVLTLLIIMLVMLFQNLFGVRPSNTADTALNKYQQFSNGGTAAIEMTDKSYNANQEFLVVGFQIKSGADNLSQVVQKDVEFSVQTINGHGAVASVIPTTDSNFVVVIKNLAPKFQALRVRVTDKTPHTDVSGTSAVKPKPVDFIVNESQKIVDNHLQQKSRKSYAVDAINDAIASIQRQIGKKRTSITHANTTIAADKSQLKTLNQNIQYQAGNEFDKTKQSIDSVNADIVSNQTNIVMAKKSIKVKTKQIKLLQEKQKDIKNGTYKLPDDVNVTGLKVK